MEKIKSSLTYLIILAYTGLVIFLFMFINFSELETVGSTFYLIVRTFCYGAVYLLPTVLIIFISFKIFVKYNHLNKNILYLFYFSIWFAAALPFFALYADYEIYRLYDYHFNGFIWNLIMTKGGIDALGATSTTTVSVIFQLLIISLLVTILQIISHKLVKYRLLEIKPKKALLIFITFFLLTGIEEVTFAYCKHKGNENILKAASYTPFPIPTSMTAIFQKLGVEKIAKTNYLPKKSLHYPLKEITLKPLESYPNIIILTAESFRWDLFNEEITPNLYALSKNSLNFTNHYSGGNRTRMGMFSLFYGLYAPYWFPFEKERKKPVLMDVVAKLNYQIQLNTSQSFDYPELRHTLFSGLSEDCMHELKIGDSWKRDIDNISMIIDSIDKRDATKPFFNFMFFESTHAPYNFPDSCIIKNDFIKSVDYMGVAGLGDNIYKLHNRYINAAHHIDQQVGRVLEYLEKNNLTEKTIVLFTGDHGEEFMEKGHWGHGHNARFTKYQTKVPFILKVPGEKPATITAETNHLQFPAYLLSKLGIENNYLDYALAPPLLTPSPSYFVLGNYNYMTIQDDKYKITFPFTGQDYLHYNIYEKESDDFVLKNLHKKILTDAAPNLQKVYEELTRFYHDKE